MSTYKKGMTVKIVNNTGTLPDFMRKYTDMIGKIIELTPIGRTICYKVKFPEGSFSWFFRCELEKE
jgi:hypothetical protein